jgi:hypothetical protein
MTRTKKPMPTFDAHTLSRACLLTASVLLAAPHAFSQSGALDAISNNEANQRQAAAAAVQRYAAQHFTIVTPGVVKDTRTGLEWMRCSLGQDWDEKVKTCNGSIRKYNWQEALNIADKLNGVGGYAKRTDWRLPTVRELQSLRYCSNGYQGGPRDIQDGKDSVPYYCAENSITPTIAQTIFPSTESTYYWSSSPYAGYASFAWYVYFLNGYVGGYYCGNDDAVRLVR